MARLGLLATAGGGGVAGRGGGVHDDGERGRLFIREQPEQSEQSEQPGQRRRNLAGRLPEHEQAAGVDRGGERRDRRNLPDLLRVRRQPARDVRLPGGLRRRRLRAGAPAVPGARHVSCDGEGEGLDLLPRQRARSRDHGDDIGQHHLPAAMHPRPVRAHRERPEDRRLHRVVLRELRVHQTSHEILR